MKNFVAELHALAEFCNYDETWNDMLREIIVFEVRDEHIQQHLLAKENLTLQRVLDITQLMEQVVENAATLRGKDSHQATAVSSFTQGNTDICTNPAFNQVHMLMVNNLTNSSLLPILRDREKLCLLVLDVLKLVIALLCASSRLPSVITLGN